MENNQEYHAKLMTPEQAVELIPRSCNLSFGMRAATPPALLEALAKKAEKGGVDKIKAYYMRCGDVAIDTIFREDLIEKGFFMPYSSMMSRKEVLLAEKGFAKNKKYINFVPVTFNQYSRVLREIIGIDVFLVRVSPIDSFGYFNFSIHGDYAIDVARFAKKVIVEVNENLPRIAGDTLLHISEVDAIVEHTAPLQEEKPVPAGDLDRVIGKYIAELIPDRATIQIGIGSVPNAVCEALVNHKDLGVHTEVLTEGVVDLIKKHIVTNKYKTLHQHKTVFNFAAGSIEMYNYLTGNNSLECYPSSHINAPHIIGLNDNMMSVNSFVEIDLKGQVNAEFVSHQFSGVGGQLDFIRGARISQGGKSILASHSTTRNGQVSKIVTAIDTIVTDTRLDVDYVVTEFGVARLVGKSTSERALALIEIAHPNFREQLLENAKKLKYL